jgi:hypothetical protein
LKTALSTVQDFIIDELVNEKYRLLDGEVEEQMSCGGLFRRLVSPPWCRTFETLLATSASAPLQLDLMEHMMSLWDLLMQQHHMAATGSPEGPDFHCHEQLMNGESRPDSISQVLTRIRSLAPTAAGEDRTEYLMDLQRRARVIQERLSPPGRGAHPE